jgi:hypothetical protein
MGQGSEQRVPNPRGRKSVSWRRDPAILARLPRVERLHLAGRTNVAIAAELDVDEGTVRNDLKRLSEIWLDRTATDQADNRARVLAELEDVRLRALEAAEWDQMCERAVLFDDLGADDEELASSGDDTFRGRRGSKVHRDAKGSAQYRGQKAQSLNVARQATMDKAKLLGIDVNKVALTDSQGDDITLDELVERFAGKTGEGQG